MVKITFVQPDGTARTVDSVVGQTLMEAGTKNGIDGIVAECGGNCTCGTCRVYPDADWQDRLGTISAIEHEMLEFGGHENTGARLSCRIAVTPALEGLSVQVPESQY